MLNEKVLENTYNEFLKKIVYEDGCFELRKDSLLEIKEMFKSYSLEAFKKELEIESPLELAFVFAYNLMCTYHFHLHPGTRKYFYFEGSFTTFDPGFAGQCFDWADYQNLNGWNGFYLLKPQQIVEGWSYNSSYRIDFELSYIDCSYWIYKCFQILIFHELDPIKIDFCKALYKIFDHFQKLNFKDEIDYKSTHFSEYFEKTSLFIEIDGYDYHKSKEQFTNDRKRDRDLKLNGFDVFRFSGDEIFNNSFKCLNECFSFIKAKARKKKQKLYLKEDSDYYLKLVERILDFAKNLNA